MVCGLRGLRGPWGQVFSDEGVCCDSREPPCPGPQVLRVTSSIQQCVHLACGYCLTQTFYWKFMNKPGNCY